MGIGPTEITFAAGRAFVANGEDDSVSVIDLASRAVISSIQVGQGPVGAWQAANGRAYVDDEAGQTLTVIDVTSLTVFATYALGFTPGMAGLAPSGELWVTDTNAGQMVRFDPDVDLRLGTIATGAGAHAIGFSADGTRGYVTNQLAAVVSVIDIASGAAVATVPVGVKPNGLVWRSR